MEALASMPVEMQEALLDQVKEVARGENRKRYLPVAHDAGSFSNVQLQGFLKSSALNSRVRAAREGRGARGSGGGEMGGGSMAIGSSSSSSSGVGGGGKEEGKTRGVLSRRIASNQGRKYILMNLAESQSESESVSESESERELGVRKSPRALAAGSAATAASRRRESLRRSASDVVDLTSESPRRSGRSAPAETGHADDHHNEEEEEDDDDAEWELEVEREEEEEEEGGAADGGGGGGFLAPDEGGFGGSDSESAHASDNSGSNSVEVMVSAPLRQQQERKKKTQRNEFALSSSNDDGNDHSDNGEDDDAHDDGSAGGRGLRVDDAATAALQKAVSTASSIAPWAAHVMQRVMRETKASSAAPSSSPNVAAAAGGEEGSAAVAAAEDESEEEASASSSSSQSTTVTHTMGSGLEPVIGTRLQLWWVSDECFYDGVVVAFDHSDTTHRVLYDRSGEQHWHRVADFEWNVLGQDVVGKEEENMELENEIEIEMEDEGEEKQRKKEEEKDAEENGDREKGAEAEVVDLVADDDEGTGGKVRAAASASASASASTAIDESSTRAVVFNPAVSVSASTSAASTAAAASNYNEVKFDRREIERRREEAEMSHLFRQQSRDSAVVTEEMIDDVQILLRLLGVPYVVAPSEAEAQCAALELAGLVSVLSFTHLSSSFLFSPSPSPSPSFLLSSILASRINQVDGIVTDDSDVFLFGAKTVYKNIFREEKMLEVYCAKDIQSELTFGRSDLVHVALLLGCDYTDGVKGVGIVNASEIVTHWRGVEGLQRWAKWMNDSTSPDAIDALLAANDDDDEGEEEEEEEEDEEEEEVLEESYESDEEESSSCRRRRRRSFLL